MKKKWKWITVGVLISSLLLAGGLLVAGPFSTSQTLAQGNSIACPTFANGTGGGSNSGTTLVGSFGQWMVASGTNGATELNVGFWNCLGGASDIFLPLVLKNYTPPILLSVRNETGSTLNYTVYPSNSGQTPLCSLSSISNGATKTCPSSFPSGVHWLTTSPGGCTAGYDGQFTYPVGTCTRVVRCSPSPSVWEGTGCNN